MYRAIKIGFNEKVVQSKPGQVAIGFPDETLDPFVFDAPESVFVAEKLRQWLASHLRDNGVEFEN